LIAPTNKNHSGDRERWQSPLDNLPDRQLDEALLLLKLVRCGAVCCFFDGTSALERAYDLHRAGMIRLTIEFEPETVGMYWRVAEGGPRK
jgi:hypothetical protein